MNEMFFAFALVLLLVALGFWLADGDIEGPQKPW